MAAPIRGGIIAAGAGSRLRADGWRVAKPLVALHAASLVVNRQQSIRERPVRRVVRILQRQLDRLAQQMRPALLRPPETTTVHGSIVADSNPVEYVPRQHRV